jgi:hypothetical protein
LAYLTNSIREDNIYLGLLEDLEVATFIESVLLVVGGFVMMLAVESGTIPGDSLESWLILAGGMALMAWGIGTLHRKFRGQ